MPEPPEPDFVVVEEVLPPRFVQIPNPPPAVEQVSLPDSASADESYTDNPNEDYADMRDCDTETECVDIEVHPDVDSDLHITRNRDGHTSADISGGGGSKTYVPTPAIRKSKLATAGSHSNPFHLPKSACNAVSVSTDMVSQVLTSLGTALFDKALQGAFDSNYVP